MKHDDPDIPSPRYYRGTKPKRKTSTSPMRLYASMREVRIHMMLEQGLPVPDIATAIGVTENAVREVQRAGRSVFQRIPREIAELLRQEENGKVVLAKKRILDFITDPANLADKLAKATLPQIVAAFSALNEADRLEHGKPTSIHAELNDEEIMAKIDALKREIVVEAEARYAEAEEAELVAPPGAEGATRDPEGLASSEAGEEPPLDDAAT